MIKTLAISYPYKMLFKKFKNSDSGNICKHGFVNVEIPEGFLSIECHKTVENEHITISGKLKLKDGTILSRSGKVTNYSNDDIDPEKIDKAIKDAWNSQKRINNLWVESRVLPNGSLIDLKLRGNKFKVRTYNAELLQTFSAPILGSKDFISTNFLEVFYGEYPNQDYLNRNEETEIPYTILYGNQGLHSGYRDLGSYNSLIKTHTDTDRHYTDGAIASIEKINGDMLAMKLSRMRSAPYNSPSEYKNVIRITTYTKSHGERSIQTHTTNDHRPNINISKFQSFVESINEFDTSWELGVMNDIKINKVINPEFDSDAVTSIIKETYRATISQ